MYLIDRNKLSLLEIFRLFFNKCMGWVTWLSLKDVDEVFLTFSKYNSSVWNSYQILYSDSCESDFREYGHKYGPVKKLQFLI